MKKKAPRITAAEQTEIIRAIDDIKYLLDSHIVQLTGLISTNGKVNAAIADEIGVARQRITFWDGQRAEVEREPTA